MVLNVVLLLVAAVSVPPADHMAPADYAPNEIIVKFREAAADVIERQAGSEKQAQGLTMSRNLDELAARYRLKEIRPVFKGFKKHRQRLEALVKKDARLLTSKEKHILRRLKRAPKGATVPDLSGIYKIKLGLGPGQSLEEAIAAYESDPDVEYAELNYVVSINLTPNDPLYPVQWSLHNIGQMYPESGYYNHPPGTPDSDIDAPEAWDIETGNWEVIVAVVDTGVDYTHRDLQANMWTDADGRYGYDFINNDNDPMDDAGHGTHCAGTIAAQGDNGLDITGVCWNAKIMALKFLGSDASGYISDAVSAFYYAVDNVADVVSNSWGGGGYMQTAQDAIDYAYSQGVIMVASAGNSNSSTPPYPAYYEHMISVAATNSNDEKASFSNYGDWVDIAAPGVDVLSLRGGGTSMGTIYDDYTTIASGTSMACPHVAAVTALLVSNNPEASIESVTTRLLRTTDDISGRNPYYRDLLGSGRLNAYKAVRDGFEGSISFDSDLYSCDDMVSLEVLDYDLIGEPNQQVTVTTDGGDQETLTLIADSNGPWMFTGTIDACDGLVSVEDGMLQVSHGHILTGAYYDVNKYGPGDGGFAEVSGTIDCQEPVISNVKIETITSSGAVVTFETNEPATGSVRCGLTCGGPYTIVGEDLTLATTHTVYLSVPASETDYYLVVDANDAVGNGSTDDNGGQCYLFTTTSPPPGIHVPRDYPTIQAAINAALDGETIWVANGTYTGVWNRDIDFKGKAITVRNENGPHDCIIDCQQQGRGFYFHTGESEDSILDGFTITNGYLTGSGPSGEGAGIFCGDASPTITNCIIAGNQGGGQGGGILCGDQVATSNAVIRNCVISGNSAEFGGGIFFGLGTHTVVNCLITNNSRGVFCWQDASSSFSNCVITGNSSAMYCFLATKTQITNCTVAGNSEGIYVRDTLTKINNSIIRDTISMYCRFGCPPVDITYSNIEGGWDGQGNIDTDPCFVDLWNGNFHLMSGSPCIDTGTNDPEGGLPPTDTEGVIRPLDGDANGSVIADMGAYEYYPVGIGAPVIEVGTHDFNFSTVYGGANPDDQILSIRNWGEGTLAWEITEDCSWLALDPNHGESTGESNDVVLSVDIAGLPWGHHDCELTISAAGALNTPRTVNISLYIQGPAIELSSTELEFFSDGTDPPDQILSIWNSEYGTLVWQITEDCPWLEVDPNSGESTGGADDVILSVDVAGMLPGVYNCALTVLGVETENSPQTVNVILHIAGPVLELSPDEFEFLSGGPTPPDQILSIWNGGTDNLLWQISEHCPWLEVEPDSGESEGQIDEVVLSVDTAGLDDGDYECELTITATGAGHSPWIVPVTLRIKRIQQVPGEYPAIQAAIDAAFPGAVIIVADGTYMGEGNRDIEFRGKAITVRSANGPENCIIDCEGTALDIHRGFGFWSGEGRDTVLEGLTIRNGWANSSSLPGCGGGISCVASSPTIRDCVITDNTGWWGAGIYLNTGASPAIINCTITNNNGGYGPGIECRGYSSPMIRDCNISGNTGGDGGGIRILESWPTIINCLFSNNLAGSGGGIYSSWSPGAVVRDCVFVANSGSSGGGLFCGHGVMSISNCLFVDNSSFGVGGAITLHTNPPSNMHTDFPTTIITNCTFTGNGANSEGGAIFNYESSPTITNCIVWANESADGHEIYNRWDSHPTFSYCDVEGGLAPPAVVNNLDSSVIDDGGNINADPRFAKPGYWDPNGTEGDPNDDFWAVGDYHLKSESGRWDPNTQTWVTDANTSLCIDAGDPFSDWTAELRPHGERINMGAYGGTSEASMSFYIILHVRPGDYPTIQAAIDAAEDRNIVVVADGTYMGDGNRDIDFSGKAIRVRSENGAENCIIDCQGIEVEPHRGFYFHSGENGDSVVEGFRITNGYAVFGGGISNENSSPTISDCVFNDNSAAFGGGLYNEDCSATVVNCIFSNNTAFDGAGVDNEYGSPKLINCTFFGNTADFSGGAVLNYETSAMITNCIMWGGTPEEIFVDGGSTAVSYCDVQGGYVGEGNIDTDPCFMNVSAGDYHLMPDSPAIDAGDPGSDWINEPWPNGFRVNIGAYGNTSEATRGPADFDDLATLAAYWLTDEPLVDIAPEPDGDGIANFLDFTALADYWRWEQ